MKIKFINFIILINFKNLELNDNKIRIGHSCALIDIIHNDENNELYLKIYNSQSSINLSFKSHSQQ